LIAPVGDPVRFSAVGYLGGMASLGENSPFARALVTGASGFIGRALCRRLVGAGLAVIGTARNPMSAPIDGVTWALGDLTEPGTAERIVAESEPDVVFHLAGAVTGSRALESVQPTLSTNLLATVNMLEAVTAAGCGRIALIGSGDEPARTDPPASPYAAAKWAANGYARMFHALYGTPVATVRPFMVYGPDQPDVAKLVPYTITSLLAGEAPRLSSGRRLCDWVYIDDVVEALVTVVRSDACLGRTVDVGTGTLHTVRHVGDSIRALIGAPIEPAWGAIPDRAGETENVADVATTDRLCGWTPATDLETGLRRTVEWYAALTPRRW
jgi:UDP-glucose 4-epimerase